MTDNEIIKAVMCCIDFDCKNCPLDSYSQDITICTRKCKEDALDLIKSYKAEIERLGEEIVVWDKIIDKRGNEAVRHHNNIRDLHKLLATLMAEAIKEFAERLKEIATHNSFACYRVDRMDIDNLVNEMIGIADE